MAQHFCFQLLDQDTKESLTEIGKLYVWIEETREIQEKVDGSKLKTCALTPRSSKNPWCGDCGVPGRGTGGFREESRTDWRNPWWWQGTREEGERY